MIEKKRTAKLRDWIKIQPVASFPSAVIRNPCHNVPKHCTVSCSSGFSTPYENIKPFESFISYDKAGKTLNSVV